MAAVKKLFFFLLLSIFFSLSLSPQPIEATEEKINKFGIHILDVNDLEKAKELVNSSGGDWGWVTVVIRDDERDQGKWQRFMDDCRQKHLVPLVRLATHLQDGVWVKPQKEEAAKWAEFLSSLNWPVEDRFIILFNEPNHAKEWGGQVRPKEYAQIFVEFQKELKAKNEKFKVLPAGLDLAASNSRQTMEVLSFLREMNWEVPGIFETLDGWVSHSYPNHGFLGKPWEGGKTSVQGYKWELAFLKSVFGPTGDLPVFITETGWPASEEKSKKFYGRETVSQYLKEAFQEIWLKDEKIKAVTPFVLNDPALFADFSWLDKNGLPHLQFEEVKKMPKISWWPKQEVGYEAKDISLPSSLAANTSGRGKLLLYNSGQSIWGEKEDFIIPSLATGILVSDLVLPVGIQVQPGEKIWLDFSIKTSTAAGEVSISWQGLPSYKIEVKNKAFSKNIFQYFLEKILLLVK